MKSYHRTSECHDIAVILSASNNGFLSFCAYVCVCVRERETEKQAEESHSTWHTKGKFEDSSKEGRFLSVQVRPARAFPSEASPRSVELCCGSSIH